MEHQWPGGPRKHFRSISPPKVLQGSATITAFFNAISTHKRQLEMLLGWRGI